VLLAKGQYRRAARSLLAAGRVKEGVDLLASNGDQVAAARVLRRLGKRVEAEAVLDSMDTDSPEYADGVLMSSAILEEESRFSEAAEQLTGLLAAEQARTRAQEVLGRLVDLRLKSGNVPAAVKSLEEAQAGGLNTPAISSQLKLLRREASEDTEPDRLPPGAVRPPSRWAATTTLIGLPENKRYSMIREVARGGNAHLYLVRDLKLGRDVVMKLLRSESLPKNVAHKYFLREAKTAASLDHPNIVKIFDYGELAGRPYIAMEYVAGKDLAQLLDPEEPAVSFRRKVAICTQLCAALSYAHERTVVHRDVKMENVMVRTDWRVKLTDFGVAKALNEYPDRSLFIVGTANYMSPEQTIGDFVDARTDIYSMGVLMYRLFVGKMPFPDEPAPVGKWFAPPPPPAQKDPGIPSGVSNLILMCLHPDRKKRVGSVDELARRLKAGIS